MQDNDSIGVFQELSTMIEECELYRQPRLSVTEIADLTGLSSKDISVAINRTIGMSFSRYINLKRLQKVVESFAPEQEKQQSNRSILHIAFDAGFNSKSSFNLAFKQEYGVSPSEYIVQAGRKP